MQLKTKTIIVNYIVVLFIILFTYTGIDKLMEYDLFKKQIEVSPIISPFAFLAKALPFFEIVICLLLVIPKFRLTGLYFSTFIMILFTLYVIAIIAIDKTLPCTCGGVIQELSWNAHLIFNCFFVMLGFIGIKLQKQINRSLASQSTFLTQLHIF